MPGAASRLAAQLPARPISVLRGIVEQAGVALDIYWLRYFTFGGEADQVEFEAYLDEALAVGAGDHSMIDHAVWEIEQGWT
jgi:hypothetical protein